MAVCVECKKITDEILITLCCKDTLIHPECMPKNPNCILQCSQCAARRKFEQQKHRSDEQIGACGLAFFIFLTVLMLCYLIPWTISRYWYGQVNLAVQADHFLMALVGILLVGIGISLCACTIFLNCKLCKMVCCCCGCCSGLRNKSE